MMKGFTLFEMLVTLIVAGVLSAIAAPSLMGLFARTELNQAVTNVRGAIQEAQREAIRTNTTCAIQFNTNNNNTTANVTNTTVTVTVDNTIKGCLRATRELNSNIAIGSNYNGKYGSIVFPTVAEMVFGFRGNIEAIAKDDKDFIINISHKNASETKCIVVSYPLAVTREGIYDSNTEDCNKE